MAGMTPAERRAILDRIDSDQAADSLEFRADRVRRARESGHSALYGVTRRQSLEVERALLLRARQFREQLDAAQLGSCALPPVALGALTRIVRP
jgi:hypothetical protein